MKKIKGKLNNLNGSADKRDCSILGTTPYHNDFTTFTKLLDTPQDGHFLIQLLQFVADGNQEYAEQILKIKPGLLLKKGDVTDGAGRVFQDISPFQYALWALDAHMWGMMLKCIPQDEHERQIKIELLKQLEAVEMQGLTYKLNRQNINKKHFNFAPILNALQTYIDFYDQWSPEEKKYHWCIKVGGLQKWDGTNDGFPSHVWDEIFRSDRSFYPTPDFNIVEKLPRGERKFYNYTIGKEDIFNNDLIGLGMDFGIFRGRCDPAGGRGVAAVKWRVERDLEALTALCKVRLDFDIPFLKQQLEALELK